MRLIWPSVRVACVLGTALGALLALSDVARAGRTAVTTGEMLGSGFDPRSLYLSANSGAWAPTYQGLQFRPDIRGRLMNFRAANALFDDESRSNDYPEANTDAFIANFDAYHAHGIRAMTVSLQGGNPGYTAGVVSAFRSDGSLKSAWMARAARVIEAADARGMVVILTYFYQRQDQVLASNDAVRAGTRNVTDWLIANGYRNVIIEIANEWNSPLHDRTIIKTNSASAGIAELVNIAKGRFLGRGWRAPVSASSRDTTFAGALREAADLALIHGNVTTPENDAAGVARLVGDPSVTGPVVMNEDHAGDSVNAENLLEDRTAATGVVLAGGSWGQMWRRYNQWFPFEWSHGTSADISGGSEANYFRAVHEHIASLTLAADVPDSGEEPAPPPSETGPRVTGLSLVDADADSVIGPLADGATIDLSSLPTNRLNVLAEVDPATVGSVAFELDDEPRRVENAAPYALAGDSGGDYRAWTPEPGSHRLRVTAFSDSSASGTAGTPITVEFAVVTEPPPPPPPPNPAEPTVTSFVLIDAVTDQPLMQLRDGAVVDFSDLGTRSLNIVADVASPVDDTSVRFDLDGKLGYRVENAAPFALAGNSGTDYFGWTPALGAHVIAATPYAERNAEGTAGVGLTLAVSVRE
jgi:hypothetical protein